MTAVELLYEAVRRGLRLELRGDKLAVIPGDRVPPEFADVLRQHKRELLDLLEARAAGLTPDCAPWLHVAKQILDGEFDGADGSTRESITIGLRPIRHPLCERALARLKPATSGDGGKV
jgi:hypothetical protein